MVASRRSPRPRRRLTPALVAGVLASLLAAPAALAGPLAPEAGPSPNAENIRDLYWLVMALAVVIFVGVEGVLIYCLRRYRARKGAVAAQIHGNTRLEIGWTVGAALILVFITAFTFIQLPGIKNPPPSDVDAQGNPISSAAIFASTDQPDPPPGSEALTIRVDGQQYLWRYQYPGDEGVFSYVDMVVPVGRTVILEITADDVIHSWWIPELGGKMDAVPGYVNKAWFKATEPGTFSGQCAELCGRNHANMVATVRAVPTDEYQRWYDGKARQIQRARQAAAQQRQQLQRDDGPQAAQTDAPDVAGAAPGSGSASDTGTEP